jgi:hypothetical protein
MQEYARDPLLESDREISPSSSLPSQAARPGMTWCNWVERLIYKRLQPFSHCRPPSNSARKGMRFSLVGVLAVGCSSLLHAQPRISEFLAVNTLSTPEIVDFSDYPDWIELENPTDQEVSLADHYLGDSRSKPLKWAFPANAVIPPRGHLIVWADGYDAVPGEVRPRGYWPWRSFTTAGLHANFSLSSEGESIILTRLNGVAPLPLVRAAGAGASVWKYLADGSDAGTSWRVPGFDDGNWPSGPGKLGYGDPAVATSVPFGPSSTNKYITTYFRHTFELGDPRQVTSLQLRLLVDDGAIIFLNGVEIVRQNLPEGPIGYRTRAESAIGGSAETSYTSYTVPPQLLQAGANLLAVEVHQASSSSSDLGFDLSLEATTYVSATTLDSVSFGQQIADISTGRHPDDDRWVSFATPTPGAPNGEAIVNDIRQAGQRVAVSLDGGHFSSPQTVTLEAAGEAIHYTLDGSLPLPSSPAYAGPLEISTTTILRARAFAEGCQPGPVETRSYFIGEEKGTLPTVSLVADPQTLFGDRIGIYYNKREPLVSSSSDAALGLRDVYKGKDAPSSVEFIPADGSPGFRVNGGIRMGGENNWVHGQRAMNFSVSGKYGDDQVSYDLFPGSGIPAHTSFTLREGGDAWAKEMLRDAMWPFLAKDHLKIDTSDYRPSVVYINGVYWGIHNIRSRWDKNWFFQHKRINSENLDHLLYAHVTSSATTLGVERGDTEDWLDLLAFLNGNDLTLPENQAVFERRIDLDSFIDFVVAESYGINTSWRHNREFWRERKPGAKWQWFLPDVDQTFRESQLGTSVLADMLARDEILLRLKTNPAFVARLAQRFAAHMASTFTLERVNGILSGMAAEVEAEVPRHVQRWQDLGGMTVAGRAAQIQGIRNFAASRSTNIYQELQSRLGVSAPVTLTLAVNEPAGGTVRLNGVAVGPGAIRVFPNLPFELQAEAAPGFRFAGWSGVQVPDLITLNLQTSATVSASFQPSGENLIAGTLAEDTVLTESSYVVTDDLIVPPGTTLTLAAGVDLRMAAGRHLRVLGRILVNGSDSAPVSIRGRNGARWGGISFENPTAPSVINHLVIRGATRGHDPGRYPSAISGLNADLVLNFIDIDESEGPVFARGGSTRLSFSRLHTPYTGDCINVKGGDAETIGCTFIGNNAPDTDAIDYDGVIGGIIRDNRILRFQGFNSDAIDVGEQCRDVLIERNLIYYCSDKAFSVGQGSTVTIRRNLAVGCALGVGIKDYGSHALIENNTFANCASGVEIYEKNFANGGGGAEIVNTLFSGCSLGNVAADALSSFSVRYSLSDTTLLEGDHNLLADPRFGDPSILNFELAADSPAIDAGDPSLPPDPDSSPPDIGAGYLYSPDHYPYPTGRAVVIEEILAAQTAAGVDWVKLHNRAAEPVDIGGWFLSNSDANLMKYRFAAGTVIPAQGYLSFRGDDHFGVTSTDPGRIYPFAISGTGGTLYLSSGNGVELTEYRTLEAFGPSMPGVSLGNYYKAASNTFNFVPLQTPNPGGPNSAPLVGPVVISEIMYQPAGNPDAEYLELMNISELPVTLYDEERREAWRLTDGIEFEFPTGAPLTLAAGERVILTRSRLRFLEEFSVAQSVRVLEWTSGRLSNEGERVQLGRPAAVDASNQRTFARVDRVTYDIAEPWPSQAAGQGMALSRLHEDAYGNDFDNWVAAPPSPGTGAVVPEPGFEDWIAGFGLDGADSDPSANPDGDQRPNLVEYALGSSPAVADVAAPFTVAEQDGALYFSYWLRNDNRGVEVLIEHSTTLEEDSWSPLESIPGESVDGMTPHQAVFATEGAPNSFFRMRATLEPK